MQKPHLDSLKDTARPSPRQFGRVLLMSLWHVVRLPLLATLLALEPLVQSVFSGIAVLGILMSLFFEFIVRLPHFPFALMLVISVGSATMLMPYYLLIRLLSSPE